MATAKKNTSKPKPPAPAAMGKKAESMLSKETNAKTRGIVQAKKKVTDTQSRRMNAQAASAKLGALSNKPVKNPRGGMWASDSVQSQASDVAQTQKRMYPGTKFKGYTTVNPGRADAKPSPKKQSSIKKK